jgi:glutamyl endopeptidase
MVERFSDAEHTPVASFDVGDEVISDESSGGEGYKAEELPASGFEAVEGYEPPAAPEPQSTFPESAGSMVEGIDVAAQWPDVGEASFGPRDAVREVVHGPDDRVQITNTAVYPWRAHAALRITAGDNSVWIGTGWFVGPKLLVTAGHCVFIRSSVAARHGWARQIVVMPGRNGAQLPYGSVTSSRFWSVLGWTRDGNQEYDYGAIVLDQPLGGTTGWFGFGNWPSLDGVVGNISGYPVDKPAGTQWYAARQIASANARKVYYDVDTAGGQSGSAVYRFWNSGRYGIAVHAYGGGTVNSGTRINGEVLTNIKSWKAGSEA